MRPPHPLSIARRRLLAGVVAAAGALMPLASCAHLQDESGTTSSGSTSSGSCPAGAFATYMPPASTDVPIVLDGGVPPAMGTCGTTERLPHTPGIGADGNPIDISQATGYTLDTTIPGKAANLLAGSTTAETIQMYGPPSTAGGAANFNDIYRTLDDTVEMIKGTYFRDGPRGVNLESSVYLGQFGSQAVNYGPGYATAFPVTMAHGATWDLDLEAQIGSDLADEVLASGNTETISPCVNLLRHPAWGRAEETYGEDSFAVGRIGTAYVEGAQSYIPACVKHLAAYNIEDQRFNNVSTMDSQTLHEIYGRHFEMIVQEGGVACVMASYNSIQVTDGPDTHLYKDTQNPVLLGTDGTNGMLRGTFGFKGYIMSDFWAMPNANNTMAQKAQYDTAAKDALNAGLDMEMPWNLNFKDIADPTVAQPAQLTTSATRIVEQKLRFNVAAMSGAVGLKPAVTSFGTNGVECNNGHLADAELQAEESIVLLKNDNNTLPIPRAPGTTIAVIGAVVPYTLVTEQSPQYINFATDARIGDHGSSRVAADPAKSVGPFAGIQAAANMGLADSGADAGNAINVISGSDASLADNADFVVVVVGLTPQDEGEEYTGAGDRLDSTGNANLRLDPKSSSPTQDQLVMDVAAKHKPMVVVVEAGSGIDMPWIDSVPAVVMAWYPGQQGGKALGRLLFDDVNFSGKLPITWPVSEADLPPFSAGSGGGTTNMDYYLGYRYYDAVAAGRIAGKSNIKPLYALGSGLSYTTFRYEFMNVPCTTVSSKGVVDVQVAVTNTGTVPGNEVSFLFVSYPQTTARRSVKELKGFHRTSLIQPGQTVMFTIPLRIQDLKYWNTAANAWAVESGPVKIMVGPSSDNLQPNMTATLTVTQ